MSDVPISPISVPESTKALQIYPEDLLADVMKKLYILTGIPMPCQHVILFSNEGNTTINTPECNGVPINNNILDIDLAVSTNTIGGIPIDKDYFNYQSDITSYSIAYTNRIKSPFVTYTSALVVDIRQLFNNMIDTSWINDIYQIELLYYGIIFKYWPMELSTLVDILTNVPLKIQSKPAISSQIAKEQTILRRIYSTSAQPEIFTDMQITNSNLHSINWSRKYF